MSNRKLGIFSTFPATTTGTTVLVLYLFLLILLSVAAAVGVMACLCADRAALGFGVVVRFSRCEAPAGPGVLGIG